jgi:UDP-glucose 4-epimerase
MSLRVLVTGGAGFIGSHIVEALVARGHTVAVLDNLSSGKREQVPDGVSLYELDITDSVDAAFEEFRPEVVCHQAAQVSVSYSVKEPVFDANTNILGSIRVIDACRRFGVRKVVYASSAASYGALETSPLHEGLRCHPVSFYGASKFTVEHYLRTASKEWGIEWVALRYSNVYGPRQDPHGEAGVVAIFSNLLLAGKQPTVFGGGELTRDYVFVEDVAAANCAMIEADVKDHSDPVFNTSTTLPTTTNRVFELLRAAYGVDIEAAKGPWRAGDVQDSILDNAKIRAQIDWQPTVSLDDGIAKTAEFFSAGVKA